MRQSSADTAAPARILIVDDEEHVLDVCGRVAERLGYCVAGAQNGEDAARLMDENPFDIVLTDVRMPRQGGFELFRHVKANFPRTIVVMMTAYGTIDQAVEAMKSGVFDYITKPFNVGRLDQLLRDLADWRRTSASKTVGRGRGSGREAFHGIVGQSPVMQEVFERITRAASVDSTVLIQGESGTGKELVARAVHVCSRRAGGPFLPIACNALSETLVESELFGHVKGAFTGADRASVGILRAAENGTVFLDEIGEVPTGVQAKFLRALQEREVRPVGGVQPERFNARVVAATNRDLEASVVKGTFRRDLFYRLHVVPIYLPPLRDRREDIPLLVDFFLKRRAEESEGQMEFSDETMALLARHDWPGNVRELENCIEQACVFAAGPCITPEDLPAGLSGEDREGRGTLAQDSEIKPLDAYEEAAVRDALEKSGYNKRKAARALGITPGTLYAKIRKYGIDVARKPTGC